MIEEVKTESNSVSVEIPVLVGVPVSHERGEVGEPTASLTIKQMWNASPTRGHTSLKKFARQLLKDKNPIAQDWFANKAGKTNSKRTDANTKKAIESRSSSKSARRKSSK